MKPETIAVVRRQVLFSNHGVWDRLSTCEYRGTTVFGTVHAFKVTSPSGRSGWEFCDSTGTVLARIRAPRVRNCTAARAIDHFDKKYLGG